MTTTAKTMKALVKYADADGSSELRDVPVPVPGPKDVLVEVAYVGVCGTDPHMHHNQVRFDFNYPFILGHEFSGTIVALGDEVSGWKLGQRVTSETHADYCGECEFCRNNFYQCCRRRKGFGFHVDGAFTKYVKVPSRVLHRVPEGVSLKAASLTEPLCVAYQAVVVNSHVRPGDLVLVIGPGPIGLLCAKMAEICGASEIVVSGTDGDDSRLQLARQCGATTVINSSREDPLAKIKSLGDGMGAHLVLDTAGFSPTLKLSIDAVRPGGQITKLGWGPGPVGFSLDPLIAKAATLKGSFSHTWNVWEACLRMLEKGQVDLEEYVSHVMPLDRWEEAFQLIDTKVGVKVVLTPLPD
jgi:L-iditol 2-dehydrogenase